jgi:hypothetical protein
MMPAFIAAFLINYLCSSFHRAGTVNTHLIFALINLPTYSSNFFMALSAMNLRLSEITTIKFISLPSTLTAFS